MDKGRTRNKKTNSEAAYDCGKDFGGGCAHCCAGRRGRVFLMTDSCEKATNVCLQISAQDGRGALQICRVGTGNDSMPGLDFFVTTHGDPDAPQELFIYRRWPIDRLSKVMDTVGGPYQNLAVGALLFTSPEGENERKPLQSMLFYSANEEKIARCRYTLRIRDISDDESTQAVMETSVISSSEFLFSVLGLGERYGREITLTKASFYRLDGSEVYTLLFGVEST